MAGKLIGTLLAGPLDQNPLPAADHIQANPGSLAVHQVL
jgi:hypothetical protein